MKRLQKVISIILTSAFTFMLPLPLAYSCGVYYYGEDYRVAFLNPYVIGDDFSAFFYSADRLNKEYYDRFGSDRRRNCEEWAQYLGGGATAADARAVVYQASYDDLLNAVAEGADGGRFAGNAFFQNLMLPARKAALEYLLLAKQYEYVTFLHEKDVWESDPWRFSYADEYYSYPETGTSRQLDIANKMEAMLNAATDPFLRRRYAYQMIVTHAAEGTEAEKIYRKYFTNSSTSMLNDWANFHRAGWVQDTVEANYLLAMSFGSCPEKRLACYHRFNKKLAAQTLALCKTDAERALVLALVQLRNPGRSLPELQKIAALDAASPLLPVLLVREISKLEDWLLTHPVTGLGEAVDLYSNAEERWEWTPAQWYAFRKGNRAKDVAYLSEVRAFIQNLQGQKSSVSADQLKLFAGHLYLLEKNGGEAKGLLATISKSANAGILEQRTTEEVLVLLNSEDIQAAGVQERLADLLTRLAAVKDQYQNGYRDFMSLNLLVSQAYERRGDVVTAFFFNNSHTLELPSDERYDYGTAYYDLIRFLDWRATEKDMDAVLALMDKKNKNAFERYLTSGYLPSRNALLDLRGTISFRKNDLQESLKGFGQVQPDFWKTKYAFSDYLVSDPFVVWSDSLHRGEFPLTKASLVQRMISLENEAKNNPAKAAENYLMLATAWYNFTYAGKSWMMFSYGNSTGEQDAQYESWFHLSFSPKGPEMTDVYYRGKRAVTYLEKAKSAAKTPEMLARIAFLSARNAAGNTALTPEELTKVNAMEWNQQPGFYTLREMSFYKNWSNDYKRTAYFAEVRGICPVLAAYFGK